MLASEMIKQLQELVAKNGDKEVRYDAGLSGIYDIDEINFDDSEDEYLLG